MMMMISLKLQLLCSMSGADNNDDMDGADDDDINDIPAPMLNVWY